VPDHPTPTPSTRVIRLVRQARRRRIRNNTLAVAAAIGAGIAAGVVRTAFETHAGINIAAWGHFLIGGLAGAAAGTLVRHRQDRRRTDAHTALCYLLTTSINTTTKRCAPDAIADLAYLAAHHHQLARPAPEVHSALLDTFSVSPERIHTPWPAVVHDVPVDDIMLLMRYRDLAQRHTAALNELIRFRTGRWYATSTTATNDITELDTVHRNIAAALREIPADICAVADLLAGDIPLPSGHHRQQLVEFAEQNPWQNLIDTATALTP
jgi:hypothetical protein